jgi:uncharacterized repeat protein (TIGR01451 family)
MGNYSRVRLPETALKEIWDWMHELGVYLAPLHAEVTVGDTGPDGVTYTVTVTNAGVKDKGVTMEGLEVALVLPPGAKVVRTAGQAYEGVRRDAAAESDVVAWRVPRLPAGDRRVFTITLSPAATALRGTLRWAKPAVTSDGEVRFALATGGRGGRGGE